jgi:hypothetical protein
MWVSIKEMHDNMEKTLTEVNRLEKYNAPKEDLLMFERGITINQSYDGQLRANNAKDDSY